jgi:hypothetical protein
MANKRYKLIVKTNSYTGNFHREFNAYVFGCHSDCAHEWVEDLNKSFDKESKGIFSDNVDDNTDAFFELYHHFYDEYGSNISELSDFGGNGVGTLGITVYFDKDPTKYLPFFMKRIESFPCALAKSWEFAEKNLKIESVELIEETTTEKSLWKK